MDATKDRINNYWAELKSKLRMRWRKITDDDLAQINGNSDELVRILRKRYGYGKEQAEIEINRWLVENNGH